MAERGDRSSCLTGSDEMSAESLRHRYETPPDPCTPATFGQTFRSTTGRMATLARGPRGHSARNSGWVPLPSAAHASGSTTCATDARQGGEQSVRFIATADWQLGMTAHFLDDQARPRFLQARFDAVRRIAQLASDRQAQFVVVCGDVFESNQLDRAVVSRAFEALSGFTVPVLLLPGNHDPVDAASIYGDPSFTARPPGAVHVLRQPGIYEVVPGVEVAAAPWSSKRPGRDLVADVVSGLDPTPAGVVRVVAGHGAVASLSPDASDPAVIDGATLRRALDGGLAQVAVLGDRHSTTQVDPRIWYPGTPEVTARREEDPGNVLVINVDAATGAVDVEKVPVGRWRFLTVHARLDDGADLAVLEDRLRALDAKERTAVWLALSGTLTLADRAHLDTMVDRASELFARVGVWQSHTDLAVVPDDHDFADLQLGGFADQAVSELVRAATGQDPEQALDAQGALRLLYRLVATGSAS